MFCCCAWLRLQYQFRMDAAVTQAASALVSSFVATMREAFCFQRRCLEASDGIPHSSSNSEFVTGASPKPGVPVSSAIGGAGTGDGTAGAGAAGSGTGAGAGASGVPNRDGASSSSHVSGGGSAASDGSPHASTAPPPPPPFSDRIPGAVGSDRAGHLLLSHIAANGFMFMWESLLSTVGRGAATADDGTAGPAADGDRQRSGDRGVGKGSASRRDDKRSPGDRGVNGGDSGSNSSCSSSSSSGSSTTVSGRNGVSGESADGWLEAQCGLLLSDALAAPGGVHGLLEVTVGNSSDDSVTTAAASVAMLLAKVPIELLSPDEYVSAAMEPLCARVTSLALCDGVGVCVSTPSCLHV